MARGSLLPFSRGLILGLAAALGFGVVLSGCGGGGGATTTAHAPRAFVYKLGPGDTLNITVYEQADLTNKYVVDGSGNLAFPLIGKVAAAGKTTDEVRDIITTELNAGYLVNPKVTVQMASYRPYYILGEVAKPGSYPYSAALTVREAVAVAGGFTRIANESSVKVTRPSPAGTESIDETPDDYVEPGDTITVERRLF